MRKSYYSNKAQPVKRRYSVLNTTQLNSTNDFKGNLKKDICDISPVKTTSFILEDSFELSRIENKENLISEDGSIGITTSNCDTNDPLKHNIDESGNNNYFEYSFLNKKLTNEIDLNKSLNNKSRLLENSSVSYDEFQNNCVSLDFSSSGRCVHDSPKRKIIKKSIIFQSPNNEYINIECDNSRITESCNKNFTRVDLDSLPHINISGSKVATPDDDQQAYHVKSIDCYSFLKSTNPSAVLHYSFINSEILKNDSLHSTEYADTTTVSSNLNNRSTTIFLNENSSASHDLNRITYNTPVKPGLVDTSILNNEYLSDISSEEVADVSNPLECSNIPIKDLNHSINDKNSSKIDNYSFFHPEKCNNESLKEDSKEESDFNNLFPKENTLANSQRFKRTVLLEDLTYSTNYKDSSKIDNHSFFHPEKCNNESLKEDSKEESDFNDLFPKEDTLENSQRFMGTTLSEDLSCITDHENLDETETDLFCHPERFSNKSLKHKKDDSSFMDYLPSSNDRESRTNCGEVNFMNSIFNSSQLNDNTLMDSASFPENVDWGQEFSNSIHNSRSFIGSCNDDENKCLNSRFDMNTSHFDLSNTSFENNSQQEMSPQDSFGTLENLMSKNKNDLDTSFFALKRVPASKLSEKQGNLENALSSEGKYSSYHKNIPTNPDNSVISFSKVDNNFKAQSMTTKDWNLPESGNKPLKVTKEISRISKQVSFNLNHEYIGSDEYSENDFSSLMEMSHEKSINSSPFNNSSLNQQSHFSTAESFKKFPRIENNMLDIYNNSIDVNQNSDVSHERISSLDSSNNIELIRNSKSYFPNVSVPGVSFELANLEDDKFIFNDSKIVGGAVSQDLNVSTVLDHSMIHFRKPHTFVQRFSSTPRSINQYVTPKNIHRTTVGYYSVTKQSKLSELIAATPSMLKFSSNPVPNLAPSSVILKNRFYSLPDPLTKFKVSFVNSFNDKSLALVNVVKLKASVLRNKVLTDFDTNALLTPIAEKTIPVPHPEIARLFIHHIGNSRLKLMKENIASLKTLIDKYGDKITRINKMKTGVLSKCIYCSNQRLCNHYSHLQSLQEKVTSEVFKDYKVIMEKARRKYNEINIMGEICMNQELAETTNAMTSFFSERENEKEARSDDRELELKSNQLLKSEIILTRYEESKSLKKAMEPYLVNKITEKNRQYRFFIDRYINPLREAIISYNRTDFWLMGSRVVISATLRTDTDDQYLDSATVTAIKTLQPMATNIEQYFQNLINNNLITQPIPIVKKSLLKSQMPILLLFNDFRLCDKLTDIVMYWKLNEPFKLKAQIAAVMKHPIRFSVQIDLNPIETYQHRVLDYDIQVESNNVDLLKVREILDSTPNGINKLFAMFSKLNKSLLDLLINN